jgi:uncharacterized OB-fold protein
VSAPTPAKPIPVPDALSAGYWEATARGQLAIARCSHCGRFTIPPQMVCRSCQSTEPGYVFEPVSGNGTIRSWTVIRMAFLPGFRDDVPYVLVDVELDEQADLRMVGRLTDGPEAQFSTGRRVSVTFDDVGDRFKVPAFTLDAP